MTPTYVSRLNPFSIRFPLPIRDKNFKASFFFFFFFLHYLISQDRRNIIIVRRRSSINNSTDEIHPRLITFVHFALARHLADKAKNKRVCKSEKLFQRNSLFLFLFFFFFFPLFSTISFQFLSQRKNLLPPYLFSVWWYHDYRASCLSEGKREGENVPRVGSLPWKSWFLMFHLADVSRISQEEGHVLLLPSLELISYDWFRGGYQRWWTNRNR